MKFEKKKLIKKKKKIESIGLTRQTRDSCNKSMITQIKKLILKGKIKKYWLKKSRKKKKQRTIQMNNTL